MLSVRPPVIVFGISVFDIFVYGAFHAFYFYFLLFCLKIEFRRWYFYLVRLKICVSCSCFCVQVGAEWGRKASRLGARDVWWALPFPQLVGQLLCYSSRSSANNTRRRNKKKKYIKNKRIAPEIAVDWFLSIIVALEVSEKFICFFTIFSYFSLVWLRNLVGKWSHFLEGISTIGLSVFWWVLWSYRVINRKICILECQKWWKFSFFFFNFLSEFSNFISEINLCLKSFKR